MWTCISCGSVSEVRMAFCWSCLSDNSYVRLPKRPTSRFSRTAQRANAHDLAKANWTMVEAAAYPSIRTLAGAFGLLYGGPGAGKSTLLAKWLDSIEGPVTLAALEEGIGPAVSERLARLNIRRADFGLWAGGGVDDLIAELGENKAKALGVDSLTVSQMLPGELRRVQQLARVPLVLGTLQVTKAGLAAGSNAWLHEADLIIHVEDMSWQVEKSRYQPPGTTGKVAA